MTRAMAAVLVAALAAPACAGATAPTAAPEPIDVLSYLVGDATLYPRFGTAYSHQIVDTTRQEVCWVKYANPRSFECWRWDDSFVYHAVDHAIDGNTGESYRFEDGRWMPRYLSGDWSLDVRTRIVWFDRVCGIDVRRSGPFTYHQRVWRAGERDIGGDLGVRDVIILEYAPDDPAGGPTGVEHFSFARGAGWYEWDRVGVAQRVFNRIGGPATPVARETACTVR